MDLNTNSFVLLPLKRSDNPISIDYDPVDGKVYWTEVTLREIHSITIDAQDQHVVKYLGDSKNLSRDMRFPTMWYVRSAKAQTCLLIRAV